MGEAILNYLIKHKENIKKLNIKKMDVLAAAVRQGCHGWD